MGFSGKPGDCLCERSLTMTRKRLLLCLLASIAFFTSGFILLSLRTGPRINQASFDEIQEGMTEAEVVEILGGPAGDYGPGMELRSAKFSHIGYLPVRIVKRWSFGDSAVTVWFNTGGAVVGKEWEDDIVRLPQQQGILEKFRSWCRSAFSRWL
jgi:hypothetical protein